MPILPIADDGGSRGAAIVCFTFMALCGAGFLWQLVLGPEGQSLALAGAFTPGRLFGSVPVPPGVPIIPPPATLMTYLFLHAGWLHLLGNLLYLWVFGPRVEAALGAGPFSVFFISCGVVAALAQAWTHPASSIPVVGVSGAASGVLGAYLLFHPRAEVRIVVPVLVVIRVVSLPAFVVLAAWFGFQLLNDYLTPAGSPGIAFRAHVAGFVAGMLLAPVFAPGWLRLRRAARGG